MLRAVCNRLGPTLYTAVKQGSQKTIPTVTSVRNFGIKQFKDYDAEFDKSFIDSLDNKDIDGWTLRGILTDYHGHDVIPEPPIMESALRACRRVDDIALAIRFLEAMKRKCGNYEKQVWPWLMQEITPTLQELGIPSLEALGYHKPELYKVDVFDM